MLVNQGKEFTTARVGGQGDGPNQVSVDGMERMKCLVEVALEREEGELSFHT